MRLLIADETGPDFRRELTERLAAQCPSVELADVGTGPADALVVGGAAPAQDLDEGLRAGVRWIQALTTGVEQVLTPPVVDSDVVVTNSAAATAPSVSEFAFARMLEHVKELPALAEQQRRHTWSTRWLGSLAGSTLLVVGLGAVGRRIAELGRAFGMHVLGIRRRPEAGPGPCNEVGSPSQLHQFLGRADFTVLVPALTPETRQLIGHDELAAMPPGAFLVNVGRGELIDHHALAERASAGDVFAALDVFPEEPLPPDSPLWDCPQLRISSHNAALTPPLVSRLADLVSENVQRFVAGQPLHHLVDKNVGYPRT